MAGDMTAETRDGGNTDARIRGRRPPHGEPVLDRAFRILASFGPDDRSLSLTSLSARAGLPAPSALRIVRKLVELGALERDEDGRYMIGLRLLEIASLAPRGHGLRGTALPYMEDLHHATGQHVLLAVRDGHQAILVERLSAHRAGRVLYRIGGRMPMHATGVGLILLAHAPLQVQEEVLAGDLTVEPGHPLQSERELRAVLAAVRRDGVAVASRERPEPMTSVAAPVLNNRRVVAALSVVAQSGNLQAAAAHPGRRSRRACDLPGGVGSPRWVTWASRLICRSSRKRPMEPRRPPAMRADVGLASRRAADPPETVQAGGRTLLIAGAAVAAVAAIVYLVALATHPMDDMLKGFDLQVYLGGAHQALHHSHSLYTWVFETNG